MDAQPFQPAMTHFEIEQQRLSVQNRGAVLTMWTGLGAILSLLLTCFLGSLWRTDTRTALSAAVMVVLLAVSLILFFTAGKKDERWYVVCSLLNHAGIGLAVLILLDVLGLDVRLKQLALSGLPAAAILFAVVMIYVGVEEQSRQNFLYVGAVLFGFALLAALYLFYIQRTEFWLCTAVCALLSCVNLCALIWTAREPEARSICKALAVASFGVYIALAVAAIAALALAVLGKSDRDSKSSKKLLDKLKGRRSSGSGGLGGGSLGSGASASSGSVLGSGLGTGYRIRGRTYMPSYFWYYGLYHGSARSRARNAEVPLTEEERLAEEARLRRRRRIVFCVVAAAAILVIVFAVVFGRG